MVLYETVIGGESIPVDENAIHYCLGDRFGPFASYNSEDGEVYILVFGQPAIVLRAKVSGDAHLMLKEVTEEVDVQKLLTRYTNKELESLGYDRESALRYKDEFLTSIGYVPVTEVQMYLRVGRHRIDINQYGLRCPNFPYSKALQSKKTFEAYINFVYKNNYTLAKTKEEEDEEYREKVDEVNNQLQAILEHFGYKLDDDEPITMEILQNIYDSVADEENEDYFDDSELSSAFEKSSDDSDDDEDDLDTWDFDD